jgi:hypothetical protein
MVHALEKMHRLLKPNGTLIDIHPVAGALPLEIHQRDNIDLVGYLSIRQWITDYQYADNALAEIVQRGQFVIENADIFESLSYYNSTEEMRTALKKSVNYFDRGDESTNDEVKHIEMLVTQAEKLMQATTNGAELVLREPTHISRLKPI